MTLDFNSVLAPRDALASLERRHRALLLELATIVDHLDQWGAVATSNERTKVEHLRMRLLQVLVGAGVRPTARVGDPLDLRFHEVIDTRPATEAQPASVVVEVVSAGYELLAGTTPVTLRQARVVVAVTDPAGGDSSKETSNE